MERGLRADPWGWMMRSVMHINSWRDDQALRTPDRKCTTLSPAEASRHSVRAMHGIGSGRQPARPELAEPRYAPLHTAGAVRGKLLIRCTSAPSSQFGERAT